MNRDALAAQPYPEALYRAAGEATERLPDLAAIDEAARTRFAETGYLVIDRAFGPAPVAAALAGLADLIAGRCPDFQGVQFEAATPDLPADDPDRWRWVRKLMGFVNYEPRLAALAHDEALRAVLRRLLGAEPELFQDMALLKPPGIGREKPWHQDSAYFNIPPETPVVGVWLALDPARPENGCMQLVPGSHLAGPQLHFQRRDWQLCDTAVASARSVVVPLEPGGLLLFNGLVHHGTPANRSPLPRRALQFHYRPRHTPATDRETRLAIWGGDGQGVEC